METYTTTFVRTEEIAENTFKYVFTKPDGFVFEAGQYVILEPVTKKFDDDRPGFRSFSMASAPCENELFFIMRGSKSALKKNLHAMAEGDEVTLKGPLGHFTLPEDPEQAVVFLVAGVGVTPARAMLVQSAHENSSRPMTILCSNRTVKAAPCLQELTDLDMDRYTCVHAITDETDTSENVKRGKLDADSIAKFTTTLENPLYYVVGTKGFIEGMKGCLTELGVEKDRIVIDNFG